MSDRNRDRRRVECHIWKIPGPIPLKSVHYGAVRYYEQQDLQGAQQKQKNSGSPYAISHQEIPDATINAYVLLPPYRNKEL